MMIQAPSKRLCAQCCTTLRSGRRRPASVMRARRQGPAGRGDRAGDPAVPSTLKRPPLSRRSRAEHEQRITRAVSLTSEVGNFLLSTALGAVGLLIRGRRFESYGAHPARPFRAESWIALVGAVAGRRPTFLEMDTYSSNAPPRSLERACTRSPSRAPVGSDCSASTETVTSTGSARVFSLEVPERALSEQTIGGGGPAAWLAQLSPVCQIRDPVSPLPRAAPAGSRSRRDAWCGARARSRCPARGCRDRSESTTLARPGLRAGSSP